MVNKSKLKSTSIQLTPEVKKKFQDSATALNMSLSEYLRRAAFAAEQDPSILTREGVEEAEEEYKTHLGPSRWTRDNDHS